MSHEGEQIFYNREALARKDWIHDASSIGLRILHDIKSRNFNVKAAVSQFCAGIVGVTHKGYHSLNRWSALKHGRRIGDCMIEVSWDKKLLGDKQLAAYVDVRYFERPGEGEGVTQFATFETRTDWCKFRGQDRGDWEIYRFAKDVDNGSIPPSLAIQQARLKNAWKLIRGTASPTRSNAKKALKVEFTYSDSEAESDEEGDEESDAGFDRYSDSGDDVD